MTSPQDATSPRRKRRSSFTRTGPVVGARGPSEKAKEALLALARGAARGERLRWIANSIGVDPAQLCRWKKRYTPYYLKALDGYYQRDRDRAPRGGTVVGMRLEAEFLSLLMAASDVLKGHLANADPATRLKAAIATIEAAQRFGAGGVQKLASSIAPLSVLARP